MELLCFKFKQNQTINEEFDFFLGETRMVPWGVGGRYLYVLISIIIGKHMKMYFKFHKNRTINEESDFWGVKRSG